MPLLRQRRGAQVGDAVMKTRMAVLSASTVLLAACATTGEQTAFVSRTRMVHAQARVTSDEAYVARVEAIARRRGIGLIWVNPPTKIVAKQE